MDGLHLTADLHGCSFAHGAMTDIDALRTLCLNAVRSADLSAVGELFHRFAPLTGAPANAAQGTGVVLLAESHLAVHTWPELGAVTLDVYVCNVGTDNSQRAELWLAELLKGFVPTRVERHALRRGALMLASASSIAAAACA